MKKFDVVIFDLDSTLVTIEGLVWLAEQIGKKRAVDRLTKLSMEGKLSVKLAMQKKMLLISPSLSDLEKLGQKYCQSLVKGARETIEILHHLGKEVFIVTGNVQPATGILGKYLRIKPENVISARAFFDKKGHFQSFDSNHPLSKNSGKATIIRQFDKKKKTVFIGDAVTDLETKEYVDLFIGYGGVAKRGKVKKAANVFLESPNLLSVLDYILTDEEKNKL